MRNQVHREIARLMTQMRRLCTLTLNKRLALVGSSLHEYAVLFRLIEDTEVPQHELAYDAAIDPAAVSRLVSAMTRSGLVTTRVDPTDKRQRFVRLTPRGRTLELTLTPVVDAALQPLLSGLNAVEEQQFLSLLRKSYQAASQASSELEVADTRSPARELAKDEGRPRRAARPRSA